VPRPAANRVAAVIVRTTRGEKILRRHDRRQKIQDVRRNADEMRVSLASHFAAFAWKACALLAVEVRLRRFDGVAVGGFTTAKKLCTGRLRGQVSGLAAAQNARIGAK